jgi:ABC-type antimicrobial peptide transport system permease subunit
MSFLRIITRGLRFHWRVHCAVALGVAAATAVLTGALIIGDSVRGSLRQLALDRLGRIDEMLIVDRFFRSELAAELQREFRATPVQVAPAILFPSASVQSGDMKGRRLASSVLVVGSEGSFWELGRTEQRLQKPPGEGEIVLNAPLAEELNAKVGEAVVVRFGKADQIPADSPLGRRTDRVATLAELKVIEIIPAAGLGRFSLMPTQLAPRNAYVQLAAVQQALDVPGKINTVFVGGMPAVNEELADVRPLSEYLTPRLEDYGLKLKHVKMTFGEGGQAQTVYEYYSLSSDRMLLDAAAERIALAAFRDRNARPVLTYLANRIEKVAASDAADGETSKSNGIPYSTVTAIDPAPGGPLVDEEGKPLPPLADDEIVLTSWAAADQQAAVGDRIRVTFFEPETTHGEEREASAEFRVTAIVPLTEPKTGFTRRQAAVYDHRPAPANDPDLTPEVKGITDQASIDDWDAPFPFDYKLIRDQDDVYWENHRTTPKAYISLAAGQKLWGSRFGRVTSIRIPAASGASAETLEREFLEELKRRNERLGLEFTPIRRQALAASAGTTPFDVLFLILSMFIIAAALALVWLLFRLGVEQRASEIGLLLALGWSRQKVRRLSLLEGGLVAAIGAAVGVAAGVGYAWLMIAGLRTWWVGAISSPFLTLHVAPLSLLAGFCLGLTVCVLTIWFSLSKVKHAIVRSWLAGEVLSTPARHGPTTTQTLTPPIRNPQSAIRNHAVAGILFVTAIALALYATRLGGEAQAGPFMGAGAALLISLLLVMVAQLRSAGARSTLLGGAALVRLAFRNASRHVGRSTATIALIACASFLIIAVSAFRMSPTSEGVGGFDLLAESSLPIYSDLNSDVGRRELLADRADELAGSTILSLRLKSGDDASCLNLYQPTQPRVLGVTPQMIAYFDRSDVEARFGWSASAAATEEEKANPWRLLMAESRGGSGRPGPGRPTLGEAVPVVLDQNTAMYSLRLYKFGSPIGHTFTLTYSDDTNVTFRIVGLLANSVLQGNLLIGEADFKRLFPQISGYRYFLIRSPDGKSQQVASSLEGSLSDEGFDATDAYARLADLLAVQNTYISTFQSLGALGLVLGTFGLAAVQLRSVFERRKELALMRAAGFRAARLGTMVLLENLVLLVGGLAIGAIAALVTVMPQIMLGAARIPLIDLAVMLGIVLVVGIATGMIAVRATLRAPLLAALRGE